MSERTETNFGNVVVLAERLKMIIEVSNTVFVSFASEFRHFFRELESVTKSLILMEYHKSAHSLLLDLLKSSFSISLLVVTAAYIRRVSSTARRRTCLYSVILLEQKFLHAMPFSFFLIVRL